MIDDKTYSELITIPDFIDRFRYLKMTGEVGVSTFGFDRYLNQQFYKSNEWKQLRSYIIVRDQGLDLGVDGYEIGGTVIVHHMNSIDLEDLRYRSKYLLDPEFLISTQINTHNAIHYGDESLLISEPIERRPDDTKLW